MPPETTLHPHAYASPPAVWAFDPESSDPGMGRMMIGIDTPELHEGWMYPDWATDARITGGVGRHTWYMAAIDSAGNVDPTPAAFTFDIYDYPPGQLWRCDDCTPLSAPSAPVEMPFEVVPAKLRRGARTARIDVVAPVRGTLRVRIKSAGARTLGARTARVSRAGHRRVAVKLGPRARAWLRAHRRALVTATLSPAQGSTKLHASSRALVAGRGARRSGS